MSTSMLGWVAAFVVILIEIFFLFDIAFNKKSKLRPLIKDQSSQEDVNKKPYSFSRTQLLWWTVIIITCFVTNMAITGNIDGIIVESSLVLLGISAGTTIAGRVIDNTQSGASERTHQDEPSEGFWIDILSDQNGVSIHRFQALLFNISIGIVFIVQFITSVKGAGSGQVVPLPELDQATLGLIGISSGTYAALKFNENISKTNTGNTSNTSGNETRTTP